MHHMPSTPHLASFCFYSNWRSSRGFFLLSVSLSIGKPRIPLNHGWLCDFDGSTRHALFSSFLSFLISASSSSSFSFSISMESPQMAQHSLQSLSRHCRPSKVGTESDDLARQLLSNPGACPNLPFKLYAHNSRWNDNEFYVIQHVLRRRNQGLGVKNRRTRLHMQMSLVSPPELGGSR